MLDFCSWNIFFMFLLIFLLKYFGNISGNIFCEMKLFCIGIAMKSVYCTQRNVTAIWSNVLILCIWCFKGVTEVSKYEQMGI